MKPMRLPAFLRLAAMSAIGLLLAAQTAAPPSAPAPARDLLLHVDVDLVQIDAVVYDRKGRPVPDLSADDFDLFVDGKLQRITAFSAIQQPNGSPEKPATKAAASNSPSAPLLDAARIQRTIVLVADDLNLSFESVAYVRAALRKFVRAQIGPNDLVAIARTSTGLGALQSFTNDRQRLEAEIEAVRWNPNGRAGISAVEPVTPPAAAPNSSASASRASPADPSGFADVDALDRQYLYVQGTMSALSAIIKDLQSAPGRKAVLLFSDGVPALPRGDDIDRIRELLRRVTDAANRSSVILNCIDARGLQPMANTAADNLGPRASHTGASDIELRRTQEFNGEQDGLLYLASQTGGRAFLNGNDLAWDIARALDDLNSYYLIGFHPPPETFHSANQRAAFHRLRVIVKRPGLIVRSRTGFFGVTDTELAEAASGEQTLAAALKSPFASDVIPLKLTLQYLAGSDRKSRNATLNVLLHVDSRAIAFQSGADGKRSARLELLLAGYDEGGALFDSVSHELQISAPLGPNGALGDGFIVSRSIHPGRSRAALIRAAVRDQSTGRIGATGEFLLLPDLGKNRLSLGTLDLGNPALDRPRENAAVRVFHPGERVPYQICIFNPHRSGRAAAHLRLQPQIFHNGEAVWAGRAVDIEAPLDSHARSVVVCSALTILNDFAPGEYYLELSAADLGASPKAPALRRWVDFRLER